MLTNYYDIIIIGGGISGLYSAYKIKKLSPKTSVLVIERENVKNLGGRMVVKDFYGVPVNGGAGVGRKRKDTLLVELCDELHVPYREYTSRTQFASTIKDPVDVRKVFHEIKKAYESNYRKDPHACKNLSFKEFAISVLGEKLYKRFVICSEYTDYEKADIYESLYNYGFDDNYESWVAFSIPWNKIIEKLVKKIGDENIHTSQNVTSIRKLDDCKCGFLIETEKGRKYTCLKTIIATTISSVQYLIPIANDTSNRNNIYKQIQGQPFLRVYGKFSKDSIHIMQQYVSIQTIVPGPLHRVIPINAEKGVYMIAYTDNDGAKALKNRTENISANRDFFCHLLEKSLGIPKNTLHLIGMTSFYWNIGTHYYKPGDWCDGEMGSDRLSQRDPKKMREEFIKKAQYPLPGMLVVGEMISTKQGWVEGALESVQAVVKKQWIDWKCLTI